MNGFQYLHHKTNTWKTVEIQKLEEFDGEPIFKAGWMDGDEEGDDGRYRDDGWTDEDYMKDYRDHPPF